MSELYRSTAMPMTSPQTRSPSLTRSAHLRSHRVKVSAVRRLVNPLFPGYFCHVHCAHSGQKAGEKTKRVAPHFIFASHTMCYHMGRKKGKVQWKVKNAAAFVHVKTGCINCE
jgi:hypothetical protein